MYGINKKEMSLVERSSIGGGNFWGLVQQKGPWKTVKNDVQNAKASMIQQKVSGGGVGEGGTIHAGHGNYKQVLNPNTVSGRNAPPAKPSSLGARSVVLKESNHYRKKAVAGMLPRYDTLGERSATEVGGHKAGGMGPVAPSESDEEMMMPETSVSIPSAPFLTEHRLAEEQVKEETGIRMTPTHTFDKKGVVRTPKQKVTMKPYEKVVPKEKRNFVEEARALMAKKEKPLEEKMKIPIISIKPMKRKTETGEAGPRKKQSTKQVPVFNPLKRKPETGGAGPRKKSKAAPQLKITTTNLPPPTQRFQSGAGKKESKSVPKKSDVLPEIKTRKRG